MASLGQRKRVLEAAVKELLDQLGVRDLIQVLNLKILSALVPTGFEDL